MQRVKKYAQVCTDWRNTIISSKFLQVADFCLKTNTGVGLDLIKNGFLSGVERIVLSGDSKVEEIDQIRFARDHVKNNPTALKEVDIQVHNNINVEALADLLAVSPKVWSINLENSFGYTLLLSKQQNYINS